MSEHLDAAAMVREIDITGKQSARQDEHPLLQREQKKKDAQNKGTAALEVNERRMTIGDGFRFGVGFLLANMLFSAVALVLFVLLLLAGLVALPRIP